MKKIKSYTDIEQSKKLAEILPLDSADMCYPPYYIGDEDGDHLYYSKPINEIKNIISRGKDNKDEYIPCWGLAALISILDFPALTQEKDDEWEVCVCDYDNDGYIEEIASNPVDACYEMILKLHEQNLL